MADHGGKAKGGAATPPDSLTTDPREVKRRKQVQKMTKILSKLWNATNADEPFQVFPPKDEDDMDEDDDDDDDYDDDYDDQNDDNKEDKDEDKEAPPLDLTTIGQDLEKGRYDQPLGRVAWRRYAKHMGGIYRQYIVRVSHWKPNAKKQLEEVQRHLTKVDEALATVAANAKPPSKKHQQQYYQKKQEAAEAKSGSKRKSANTAGAVSSPSAAAGEGGESKKSRRSSNSNASTTTAATTGAAADNEGDLTLSQREERAMEQLATYLEECGSSRDFAHDTFGAKVTKGLYSDVVKYHVTYYYLDSATTNNNSGRQRFRSMMDVARHLGLLAAGSNGDLGSSGGCVVGTGRPKNQRELENERKRLRKELDKLIKAHGKAVKQLEDYNNEHSHDLQKPGALDDDMLLEENKDNGSDHPVVAPYRPPDIESFPGFPSSCTMDVLVCWDFLCTFGRSLSLEPISLHDFCAALTHSSTEAHATTPVYLAEAHLALLKLLLSDPSSDDWWWSTLETDENTPEGEMALLQGDADGKKSVLGSTGGGADQHTTSTAADRPSIKVDLAALLAFEEDSSLTAQWLQALEDVRPRKANSGGPVKSAVKSALSVTTNPHVQLYLKKAMRKWKANAAGATKGALVWLVDRVKEARPDLWGRKVSAQEVEAQRSKVAQEAAVAMSQMAEEDEEEDNEEDANRMETNESDDEESEEEEEEEEEEEADDENDEDYAGDGGCPQENNQSKSGGGGGGSASKVRGKKLMVPASAASASASAAPQQQQQQKQKVVDETLPVTTSIPNKPPPYVVDLLLPPAKPVPLSSELVTPFTWPGIVGATACRVLHRYRRQRNEVDDALREFRGLPRLTLGERKRREGLAAGRILSESCSSCNVDEGIVHLSEGRDYLELTPVQRLVMLRILIEAAYDTKRVLANVEDNIKSRITATKALDFEERRAKKEAKEEAAAAEVAARERLAREAAASFISRKRWEMGQRRGGRGGGAAADELTEEEIINYDDDIRAEYDALPQPESFSRGEVAAMVARTHEEEAFGTKSLLVLTMEEIQARDEKHLARLQKELSAMLGGASEDEFRLRVDRETSAKMDRLERDIETLQQSKASLPEARARAVDALRDAMEDGTVKTLRAAIKTAKLAELSGILLEEDEEAEDPDCDDEKEDGHQEGSKRIKRIKKDGGDDESGLWTLDVLRDAALELRAAERKKHSTEAQKELVAKRDKCFVRTDPLGSDRYHANFWRFGYDEPGRIWVETPYAIRDERKEEEKMVLDTKSATLGAPDEEDDFVLTSSRPSKDAFCKFSRQEYHSSGLIPSLVPRHVGAHSSDSSLRRVVKSLDIRGVREGALKASVKEIVEQGAGGGAAVAMEAKDVSDSGFSTNGDEELFGRLKTMYSQESMNVDSDDDEQDDIEDMDMIADLPSAMGARVRVRTELESTTSAVGTTARYEMGRVEGWKQQSKPSNEQGEGEEKDEVVVEWNVAMDLGGEYRILSTRQLFESLIRCLHWQKGDFEKYTEEDSTVYAYRNTLGRFCGRANEAPHAASVPSFARYMLRREEDCHRRFKSRSSSMLSDTQWGGKRNGARTVWVTTLKEEGHDFEVCRNCLLTLEEAMEEVCTSLAPSVIVAPTPGFGDAVPSAAPTTVEDPRSGRELLDDTAYRFDIELESLQNVTSLWNSKETRRIYLEIVQSCTNVGVLALGLDLLCRNTQAFLNVVKPTMSTSTRHHSSMAAAAAAAEQQPGTRRMNAWQQSHLYD